MSEAYREQRPLLCDELSEEEQYGPDYPRHSRKGWAQNNVKGAAAIITRWPDHWSSLATYWWIGISMIAITVFAIYNGALAFALLSNDNLPHERVRTHINTNHVNNSPTSLPDVFMHIFVSSNDEVNLNKYVPYAEIVFEKYLNFNYNFIVLLNDTYNNANSLSAEENNEIAFNALWTKKQVYENPKSKKLNLKVQYISLSKYLDESPIKNNWKHLPYYYIEFLVRAISIWNRGGIAVNPTIFTNRPHVVYVEKIQALLQKYMKSDDVKINETRHTIPPLKDKKKFRKKVNNIRDIINILENDDSFYSNSPSVDSLSETENKKIVVVTRNERAVKSAPSKIKNEELGEFAPYLVTQNTETKSKDTEQKQYAEHKSKHDHNSKSQTPKNHNAEFQPLANDPGSFSLLPLFLEFFFHDRPKYRPYVPIEQHMSRHRKSVSPLNHLKYNVENKSETNKKTEIKALSNYMPMIVTPPSSERSNNYSTKIIPNETTSKHNVETDLTIDLKGNIIATKTACHAFVGTLFSDAHRSSEETLKDFIIAELSYFCKGLLSSCKGIDVILL